MTFKIISAGWNCADFIEWTLVSVAEQTNDDWEIMIVDDASTDPRQAEIIQRWCKARAAEGDKRWNYRINKTNLGTPRNQYEGIMALDPSPEDVIVFLDLDGDRLAHPEVLNRLVFYYGDGTLVTYGSYQPVPDKGTSTPAKPFPRRVVQRNAYREAIRGGHTGFNHLRTMKGKIFRAIPEDHFKWANGEWYKHGTDYIFMTAALELANGKYKCVPEILVLYNHANPNADYLVKGKESHACVEDYLKRKPLAPYSESPVPQGKVLYMTAPERREVIAHYANAYGLKTLIETGTSTGDTPWELRDKFTTIYTVELDARLWQAAKRRFSHTPHISAIHGDSAKVLPAIIRGLEEPALFWLDGHYCGPGSARGDLDTPVARELEIIFADEKPHIILIDDARIFDGQPEHDDEPHYHDYPSLEWVRELANSYYYDFVLKDDIVRLTPIEN